MVLDVHEAPLAGAPGLAVRGEIDASTAPHLEEVLDATIRETVGAIVLDLAEVAFMDSSGINVLMRARALLGREERDLVLICPSGPVLHLLEVVGIAELFTRFASRSAAARHLVPAG